MIYFDSDVWAHYFFFQDPAKQAPAVQKIQSAATLNQVAVSVLCLQEVSFVLSKLGASKSDINQALAFLKAFALSRSRCQVFKKQKYLPNPSVFKISTTVFTQPLLKPPVPNWSLSITPTLSGFNRSPI